MYVQQLHLMTSKFSHGQQYFGRCMLDAGYSPFRDLALCKQLAAVQVHQNFEESVAEAVYIQQCLAALYRHTIYMKTATIACSTQLSNLYYPPHLLAFTMGAAHVMCKRTQIMA